MNTLGWLRGIGASIALACVCFGLQPTEAAKRELYTVDWEIVPVSNLVEPVWVQPYTTFLQGKMLAKARYVITADALTISGRSVAEASSLIIATNFSQPLGCMLTLPGQKDVLPVDSKRNGELGCLIDTDADGRFDKFFKRGLFIGDFAWNQSMLPKKMEEVSPVEYRREDGPGRMTGIPIYVQYGWYAAGIDRLIFQICNRPNLKAGLTCLEPDIRVKLSEPSRMFEALGGRFEILTKEENRVQIRQNAPIGNYTLSVRRRF